MHLIILLNRKIVRTFFFFSCKFFGRWNQVLGVQKVWGGWQFGWVFKIASRWKSSGSHPRGHAFVTKRLPLPLANENFQRQFKILIKKKWYCRWAINMTEEINHPMDKCLVKHPIMAYIIRRSHTSYTTHEKILINVDTLSLDFGPWIWWPPTSTLFLW